jgi:tetratricopeptide (TPR) repeat protein
MEQFNQANQLQLEGKYAEAEAIYERLLTQNPDNPGLLATMGTNYTFMDRLGLAISFLKRVADGKSKLARQSDVMCNLGVAYRRAGMYPEAEKWFKKAVANEPTAETLTAYSGCLVNVGQPEELEAMASRAIKLDPKHALAHWNLAMALLEQGRWDRAWEEHEWGFDAQMRADRKLGGRPRWNGEPGTVAVYGEQGLGDEIMFASMIPDLLKTNKVILECHPRLLTLFQLSFPEARCLGTRDRSDIQWPESFPFDYQISIGSLGKFYRKSVESFPGTPYLNVGRQHESEKKKFRVGISWTGGMKEGRIRVRSIPLPWWKSILSNDCEFVSLQYTDSKADLDVMDKLGYSIIRNNSVFEQDYFETAKLVQSCDLVISCCTSVIHLAGALGVPCWVMVPNKPAWRYGIKGPMPWYRSVRLYRQPQGDQDAWRPVVEKVGYDLSQLIEKRQAA